MPVLPIGVDPMGVDPIGVEPMGVDPMGVDPIGVDPIGAAAGASTRPGSREGGILLSGTVAAPAGIEDSSAVSCRLPASDARGGLPLEMEPGATSSQVSPVGVDEKGGHGVCAVPPKRTVFWRAASYTMPTLKRGPGDP